MGSQVGCRKAGMQAAVENLSSWGWRQSNTSLQCNWTVCIKDIKKYISFSALFLGAYSKTTIKMTEIVTYIKMFCAALFITGSNLYVQQLGDS